MPIAKRLRYRYPTIKEFAFDNNPEKQNKICSKPYRCYFGDSPTLAQLDAVYGKNNSDIWLIPQIVDVSLACGLKDDVTKEQLSFISNAIKTEYGWLKTDELMLFCYNFKFGKYGRFYSRFDTQTFTYSLSLFIKDRNQAIDAYNQSLQEKEIENSKKNAISYEEYCRRHNKCVL